MENYHLLYYRFTKGYPNGVTSSHWFRRSSDEFAYNEVRKFLAKKPRREIAPRQFVRLMKDVSFID